MMQGLYIMKFYQLAFGVVVSTFSINAWSVEWSAGSSYEGKIPFHLGGEWICKSGKCSLNDNGRNWGRSLNMNACQNLVKQVGKIDYYRNSTGREWTTHSSKLKRCNSVAKSTYEEQNTIKPIPKNERSYSTSSQADTKIKFHLPLEAPKFEGNFTFTAKEAYKMPIKKIGSQFWDDRYRDRNIRWVSAKGRCERLSIEGFSGFSLANTNDYNILFETLLRASIGRWKATEQEKAKYIKERMESKTFGLATKNGVLYPFLKGAESSYGYWTIDGQQYALRRGQIKKHKSRSPDRKMTFAESEAKRNGYSAYWLPAQKCKLNSSPSFEQVYNRVYYSMIEHSVDETLPSEPKKIIPTFKKGEFEKTADFEKRKKEALNKIESEYNKKYSQYQSDLAKKKAKIEQDKRNALSSYELFQDSYKKSFMIYYGAPVVTNVEYNADIEKFSYTIETTNEKFQLQQPVPISYAQKFKEISTNSKFEPTVMVSVDSNGYHIDGIKEFLSPEHLVEKSELDKAFSSISKLDSFIEKYPTNSDYVKQAKQQRDKLAHEKTERNKKAQERRKAREVEKARQQEATTQAYLTDVTHSDAKK